MARSRNPSPFGRTVVSSRRSPANGVEPLPTRRSSRRGTGAERPAGAAAGTTAATRRAAIAARVATGQVIPAYPRLRTPYNALIHGTTAATILRASMRRLISLTVLAIALAVPAVGYPGVRGRSDDGTLSVKAGVGRFFRDITGSSLCLR